MGEQWSTSSFKHVTGSLSLVLSLSLSLSHSSGILKDSVKRLQWQPCRLEKGEKKRKQRKKDKREKTKPASASEATQCVLARANDSTGLAPSISIIICIKNLNTGVCVVLIPSAVLIMNIWQVCKHGGFNSEARIITPTLNYYLQRHGTA